MPSLFKKLLYGKELSNPYVNPYHPGHRSADQTPYPTKAPYPVYPQPREHFPSPDNAAHGGSNSTRTTSSRSQRRAESQVVQRDLLAEARQLAGRHPVTGQRLTEQLPATYAAVSGQSISHTGSGNPQPRAGAGASRHSSSSSWDADTASVNPYLSGGDAAMGRVVAGGLAGHPGPAGGVFVPVETDGERRARAEREVGGYFAPERPMVREYYGHA